MHTLVVVVATTTTLVVLSKLVDPTGQQTGLASERGQGPQGGRLVRAGAEKGKV